MDDLGSGGADDLSLAWNVPESVILVGLVVVLLLQNQATA